LLGAHRVLGGLRILQWNVEDGVTPCDVAFARYISMRDAGGFLPTIEQEFFCGVPGC
jgi:hypothetical protein